MKTAFHPRALYTAICLTALSVFAPSVQAYSPMPDLTAAGAIATLKTDPDSSPVYSETYNLGATGLRGWIWVDRNNMGADGLHTAQSRQILVTVASTPGSAVLAVDDVILGVMAGSSGTVPSFTSDCRKAFGVAIGDAEKTGAGTLRVKRWRAGTTTSVNIPMTIMGNYTTTAPYTCPKSSLILANARIKLVAQLLADPNFFITGQGYARAISGLALLGGVAPGDANYATVQTRLQTYARELAAASPPATTNFMTLDTWSTAYITLFLSEYYLSTNDAQAVTGLNNYIVALSKSQSRYGTYGHAGSLLKADGSLHGTIPPYGPVNMAGIPANLAIVVGKKALVAAGQAIDPEIDPAIQRGSDFFAWFVNKGSIPYGEHEPGVGNHGSNGKDPLCAVLFGLQANRAVETEYFARMSVAGYTGREFGHTGQGFSYLWSAMGANMGGSLAVAEHLKPVRWHLDLSRRTDGSFAYDGNEQYGAGTTADGTYLGACGYNDMNPTASYILTYGLPLQRLYITGKNANPANTLDAAKVTNAIAAATFNLDCTGFTTTQLIAALSEFDPTVRYYAAIELAKRSPTAGELTTLRGMVTGSNANGRMGACETLGLLQDATALPLITQRLDKTIETNSWVRAKAASAIRSYIPAAASAYRDTMLTAYTANATDPEVIVWDDPIQIANNYLSFALFDNIASYTINAPKNLLYPAVKAGLKQPDAYSRSGAAQFCSNYLTLPDVQALTLDIFEVITTKSQADTMFSVSPQLSGIELLRKHNCAEGLPMALSMMDVKYEWSHGSAGYLSTVLDNLATWGDSARWIIPYLNEDISTLQTNLNIVDYTPTVPKIQSTIATIDNAITSPGPINYLLPLATAQVVTTTGAKAITLTGTSPRSAVTFTNVTAPAHGTLTGTAPNLTYTPNSGYTGPDSFTFQAVDSLTTSDPGTVSIIVGTAGTGLKGEYYDNANFTNLKLTRTDAQVNFDWGTGSPDALLGADTFSVRWSGLLLVPETGSYMFSTLNSDGVRLYINGVKVIDQFANQDINWNDCAPISLTEGQMLEIQMDYYEHTGSAVAKLKWTGPSFASVNGAIIGSQWLFDGTGMPRTLYAYAQSLTLLKNTSKAITLTASTGSMTYSVVTPPAHGTLTGTAPNLIYTPVTNYVGPDSFTFKVNNGTSNSAPATVSIEVLPVNPGDVTGLALWLDASQLTGLSDGATVNTWTDKSGVGNNATAAGTPIYKTGVLNGQPVIRFNDTSSFTTADLSSQFPTAATVFIVTTINNNDNAYTLVKANNTDEWWRYDGDGKSYPAVFRSSRLEQYCDMPNSGSHLFAISSSASAWEMWNDGTSQGVAGAAYYAGGALVIGNGSAGAGLDGDIAEIVIYSRTLTAAELNAIGGYLTSKYGLTTSYPPLPTLAVSSIVDDTSGGVVANTVVNYTVTFSDDMNASTVSAADFGNAGTSAVAIGTVSETSPGVFTVPVTPTSVGTLQLRVNAGAVLNDAAGNALNTTAAITDDTTITVSPPPPPPPGGVTGLALWLDASQLTGLSDGATVNTWTDKSGVGNNATKTAGTPIYKTGVLNGQPVIRFDGASSFTTANLSSQFPTATTVFIATTISNDNAYTLVQSNPGADEWWRYDGNGQSYPALFRGGRLEGYCAMPNSGSHLFAISSSASAWEMSINGVSQGVAGANYNAGGVLTIGDGANSRGLNGDIAEILIYSRTLTAAEAGLVGSYLSGKYGLATSYDPLPVISTRNPADNATGVAVGANLVATFSENIVKGTGNITVKNLTDGTQTTIAVTDAQVTVSGAVLTINPTANLLAGKNYAIQIAATAIDDTVGNSFAGIIDDTTWSFTTVTSLNTAPVATAQSVTTAEDTAKAITLTGTDAEGNTLTYTIVTQPASGTLSGTAPNVTYTPATNYNGAASFTFKVNDGTIDSAPATVSITVTAVNDVPVANAQSVSTAEDTAKAITLTGTDVEGSALTYTIVTQPASGTLSGTAPNVTYTPAANYNGAASFTFRVNDGTVNSATATVSITVTAVNDIPVANAQSVSTAHNTAKPITLAGTDVEGSALTYTVVTQPTRGTLSGTAPNVTYTPTTGTSGPDSFTFKVNDGTVDSATATVSITVALPLPWITADIGTGMLAGSTTYSAGTFTQAGSGTVSSTSDKLRYTYQTLTGDGEIIAKISVLQDTGTSSRVGVMIRDTLANNSKQIFMGMTGTNAYRWVRRTTTGGSTTSTNSSTGTVPNTWVRVVRSVGTTITAYKSTNGTTWTSVGSTTSTTFASTCYIGLAVASGSDTTLNTSQLSNVSVTP